MSLALESAAIESAVNATDTDTGAAKLKGVPLLWIFKQALWIYKVGHRIGFIKKAINDTKKWIERWECLVKMCPWDFASEMEVLFSSRVESEL